MKCPFCGSAGDKVVDSRESREGTLIRRRRECLDCGRRYTTYEHIEEITPVVVKKDGRRESFERNKILSGLIRACEKRPVPVAMLEKVADEVESALQERSDREVAAREIGEMCMKRLQAIDKVAYVRFASVYREFKDIQEFLQEINVLFESRTP